MELKKIDDARNIKQSNRLVEARYNLTKYEQRMMIAICSQLNPNADDFERVRVGVADMAEFCKMKGKNPYVSVKNTIMRLAGRTLQIKTADGGWLVSHWLQSARYYPSEGIVEYKVDNDLKPELLQLKAAYLSTKALPLMEFRRDYSARLYFILKKMLKVGKFEYELDFFRDRFQLGETYKRFSNLKDRILEPAIAEINEKSDIDVEHKYLKKGRSYVSVEFTVTLKKKKKEALPAPENEKPKEEPDEPIETQLERDGQTRLFDSPPADEPPAPAVPGLTEGQQDLIDRLINRGVSAETAEMLVKKYPPDVVSSNLKHAVQQKDTARNLPGLIINFVENDMAGNQEKAKREAKERQKKKDTERRMAYGIIEEKENEKQEEKIDLENISDDFKKFLNVKKGGK